MYELFHYICIICIKAIHTCNKDPFHLLVYSGGWFFYWEHLTAGCYGIPYPALNGVGRLGKSKHATTCAISKFGNELKQTLHNMVNIGDDFYQGDEVNG